jgi:YD repeat-containing protein
MKWTTILLPVLVVLMLAAAVSAQVAPLNPADSEFTHNFGVDSINLQNLNIEIKVPIMNKTGAAPSPFKFTAYGTNGCAGVSGASPFAVCGFLDMPLAVNCSSVYCVQLTEDAIAWGPRIRSGSQSTSSCSDGGTNTTYTALSVYFSDGTSLALPSTTTYETETGGTACRHGFSNIYTRNGGVLVTATVTGSTPTVTATLPNGVVTGSGTTATDPFGNQLTITAGGGGLNFNDTLGTAAINEQAHGGPAGNTYTYHDTTGTAQTISQVLSGVSNLKTNFGCANYPDTFVNTVYPLSTVQFPDGNNIGFQYESIAAGTITGRLKQLTLRSGGLINYTYGTMNCSSMIPASLSRTTVDGTTTYTVAMEGTHGTTTTVIDYGKNKTIYHFQGTDSKGLPQIGIPLTISEVEVFKNTGTVAAPSYTSLSQTIYCYNGNTISCQTTAATYPITIKGVYVAPDGKSTYTRTKYTYDTGCGGSCGLVTNIDRFATFSIIGGGTIDSSTAITYGSWNGSSCVAVSSSIINLPCEVKTTAGANTLSDARYTYSSKGFQTQVQQWTNANGWITMGSATANTNGTVNTATSPSGAVTTYSYAATGSGGCNGILPTGTSTSGAILLTTSATWDCNMGKLLTSTDANSNQATFTYDLMGRGHTQTDLGGTYTITENFPSATTETIADPYVTTTLTVDGLSRLIRSQTTDSTSYDTVSSAYAFNGTQWRISTSQPCITTVGSDCTKSHFSDIDPLGRTFSTSTTSNETITHNFTQNDVQDELGPVPSGENSVPSAANAKTVQTEYDGLGRVISTCALQATGGTACGQFDGNSGILTSLSYSYSAGGTTTTATRGSQSHTSFVDQLGRLKSITLPESGTTTYTYDTVTTAVCGAQTSSGKLMKKTYPDGSYKCYDYDTRGRLTDVGAANSSGTQYPVCKRLRYDGAANVIYTAPTGYPATNIIGRIVEAATDDCTFPFSQAHMITDEWFAYDADGRVTDVWETTPNSGGWYHTTAGYAVNGALASISGVPGRNTYTITLDSNGRPDSSKDGTTTVASNVTYNGAGQPTEIDYQGSDKDTYNYDPNTGLLAGTGAWTFTVGSASETATLTRNANGTVKTLAITDGFNAGGTQTCNFNPTGHTGTGYDDVGRLVGVYCANGGTVLWTQTYAYDQYDNFSKSGTTNWNPGYNSTVTCPTGTICNHITGARYDGNGRVTYDLNNSYAWDQYGKMITANAGSSLGSCGAAGVTCITYDALGRPVEKNKAGTITELLYSPIGLTAIMSGQTTTTMRVPVPGGSL